MSDAPKAKRKAIDWEAMELDWRAGFKSVMQLSKEYGVSRAAILKHWDKEGVTRDLSAKISAKAEALVTQALVTPEVTQQRKVSERLTIEASAQMIAETVLGQREDIRRARATVQRLWKIVDDELDHPVEFSQVGELLRTEDDFGNDKLNDLYRAAISIPQQVKNVKLLADAIKVLIELERKVLRVDELKPVEENPLSELIKALSNNPLPVAQYVTEDDDDS